MHLNEEVPALNSQEVAPQADPNERLITLADKLYQKSVERGSATVFDTIKHLSTTATPEELEAYIDDTTYEALLADDEFVANMARLKEVRQSENVVAEAAIRTRQKEIFSDYKNTIVNLSGLDSDATKGDFEKAREATGHIINDHLEAGGTQEDLLKKLGILELNEGGEEVFTYPAHLFPEKTNQKWALYLEKVKAHLKAERATIAGTMSQQEFEDADKARRFAHNSATRDVHEILGLDALPENEWKFSNTRELLAKMRDHRFPTVDTAEKARTTREVLRAANALGVLSTRIADLEKKSTS